MKITVGPVGKISVGHVLDCNKDRFEEALRNYDPMLYVRWNPKKMRGHGCWEIRRRPEFNCALDIAELDETTALVKVGPREIDIVHHVLDCAFLNYDQIRKLKEMDTRQYGDVNQWQELVARKTQERQDLEWSQGMKRRSEAIRTFRRQINEFRQYILNGGNPHMIGQFWDQVSELE
jgi:hypothetical protein